MFVHIDLQTLVRGFSKIIVVAELRGKSTILMPLAPIKGEKRPPFRKEMSRLEIIEVLKNETGEELPHEMDVAAHGWRQDYSMEVNFGEGKKEAPSYVVYRHGAGTAGGENAFDEEGSGKRFRGIFFVTTHEPGEFEFAAQNAMEDESRKQLVLDILAGVR